MTKERSEVLNTSGHRPLGNRVLVRLEEVEEKSKGGIVFTDEAVGKEQLGQMAATVISLGAKAFEHPELESVDPGTRVMIAKYAGYLLDKTATQDGKAYRIIRDKDILNVIDWSKS